jgi:DNA polymerase V
MNDRPSGAECSASEPFALRVIGDEMAPEFSDGHIVIVDPGGIIRSGCFVVANTSDGMVLRQLIVDGDRWRLQALADGIAPISMTAGAADIVGVISQRAGKRRREHKRYDV